MKGRTDSSITVGFVKLPEDNGNTLSYSVQVTGPSAGHTESNCNAASSECTIPRLLPGRTYDISVTSCITASSTVCSVASNVAKIATLPKGKETERIVALIGLCGF